MSIKLTSGQPISRGRLFSTVPSSERDWHLNACVGRNTGTHDNAVGYSSGFDAATEAMLRLLDIPTPPTASESWGRAPLIDLLVYPICYCARHHVELVLKASLSKAWAILEIRSRNKKHGLPEPNTIENTHSVLQVWKQLHAICERADRRLAKLTSAIRAYIEDIDSIDPTGQTFRYATDARAGTPHLEDLMLINLEFFADGYSELCMLLRDLESHLEWIRGEYLTGTFTSMLSRAELQRIAERLPPVSAWSDASSITIKREICDEYGLTSNDFSRACNTIKQCRALAGLVGVHLPIKHLSRDVFVCLRAVRNDTKPARLGLTLDQRSTVLGLLRVGSTMYFPEELETFVRPLPDDKEEAGQFENERELHYLARKAASRPDLVERALRLLGQPELLAAFREVYYLEINAREAQLAQGKAALDEFSDSLRGRSQAAGDASNSRQV